MKRMRDYQLVTLAVSGRAERSCHVIATQAGQAILQPDSDAAGLRLDGPHRATVRFATARGHVAMLRGWAAKGVLEDTVTFTQGDRVHMPQVRKTPRLDIALEAAIAGTTTVANRTVDVSAHAILFEHPLPGDALDQVKIDLDLPGLAEPLHLTGRVGEGNVVHLDIDRASRVVGYFVLVCRQQIARHAAKADAPAETSVTAQAPAAYMHAA